MNYQLFRFLLVLIAPALFFSIPVGALIILTSPAQSQTNENQKNAADELYKKAVEQYDNKEFTQALQSFEKALKIYITIDAKTDAGKTLNMLGNVHKKLGKYPQALAFYQQALVLLPQDAAIHNNIGLVYLDTTDYKNALHAFEKALALSRPEKDLSLQAKITNNIGRIYEETSEYQKALNFYQQALEIERKIEPKNKDNSTEGIILTNLGAVNEKLGQYPRALEFYQQALVINKANSTIMNNIGMVYLNMSDYKQALNYLQQALSLCREDKNRFLEATIINNMGRVYEETGEYQKALEYYQQALEIETKIGNHPTLGITLNNLGVVYEKLGQFSKSLEYYQQALPIHREKGNRAVEGITLNNIGLIYQHQGNFDKAREFYEKALVIHRNIGNRLSEAITLNNLGQIHHIRNEYLPALDYYQQALTIYSQIGNRSGEAVVYLNMGLIYSEKKEYNQSFAYYQKALNISIQSDKKELQQKIYKNLGLNFFNTGNLDKAKENLFTAIEIAESLRPGLSDENKVALFDTYAVSYELLQQTLVAQNQPEIALEIAERGRARAFVELLATRSHPEYAAKIPSLKLPKIEDFKNLARSKNVTIVEYSIVNTELGKELYIWVIQPNGNVTLRRQDLSSLNIDISQSAEATRILAAKVRGGNSNPDMANFVRGMLNTVATENNPNLPTNQLEKSYQLLIKPIEDLLPKNYSDAIIFIPHQSLFLIPFAALKDEQGKYLIEKYTIQIAPSIQVLDLTSHQPTPNTENILIVGNPKMPEKMRLSPLPGSEKEAITIAQLLKTNALIGSSATETEIVQKMPQAKIIHLATHGLLEDELSENLRGIPGAVVFGDTASDDGLLTANEIVNLKLDADLVVLSACNTGRGNITGDGVMGLSRSFMSAGAKNVLVSLWYVPDSSTSELMVEFYQNLEQNSNKAQALRSAMLTVMKKYPKPINWAAFTLVGY